MNAGRNIDCLALPTVSTNIRYNIIPELTWCIQQLRRVLSIALSQFIRNPTCINQTAHRSQHTAPAFYAWYIYYSVGPIYVCMYMRRWLSARLRTYVTITGRDDKGIDARADNRRGSIMRRYRASRVRGENGTLKREMPVTRKVTSDW